MFCKTILRNAVTVLGLTFFILSGLLVSANTANAAEAEFYWLSTVARSPSSPITSTYVRETRPVVSGCSGDYPKHVGARCFRAETCSDRGRWGYNFDGATTCWRIKDCVGCDAPKSYPAPSVGESWGCPSGFGGLTAGLCFKNCNSGYVPESAICKHERFGLCKAGLEMSVGACYQACPRGYNGTGPVCTSKTPPGYIACGPLGYAKNSVSCGFILADQGIVAANLAMLVGGNLVGGKAGMAAKRAKKVSSMSAEDLLDVAKAFPDLQKLAAKHGNELAWLANKAKGGALGSADSKRAARLVNDMSRTIKSTKQLKAVVQMLGLTVVPNIIEKQDTDPRDLLPNDIEMILEWIRGFCGLIAFAIDMSNPLPGPHTYVAATLDVIASFLYNVYPGQL
jgi:hypothetical protein